jgi:outer membrane protein TolC
MKASTLIIRVMMAVFVGASQTNAETLDDYIKKLEDHPQVTQLLEQSEYFQALSASEMGLPDPQLIVGIDNVPVEDPAFDRYLPTSKVIGFKQAIPNYSLRKAKSNQQKSQSKRQQLVADYTHQRLEAMLIGQLAELNKVDTLKKLSVQQLKHYRSIEIDLKGQLEAGQPIYARFSELDVERTKIEQRLNDLKAEEIAIEAELLQLVGKVPTIPLPRVINKTWKNEASVLYPVVIASQDIQVATKAIGVADAAFKSNYSVQAIYKQREESDTFSGEDWFGLQATISLPLWQGSSQKPKLRAAQAEKTRAELAYDDTLRQWMKRISVLQAEREIAQDNIALLETKITSIQAMVQAANRNYESGNTALETVLKAQIAELEIASQLATQQSRYTRLAAQFNSHIIESAPHE